MRNFELYGDYYDLFNSDKDYASEINYIMLGLYKHLGERSFNILELGSGSGGHAQFLSANENVISILGIERSPAMVEIANNKNIPKFNSQVGDISKLHEIDTGLKYNVALSLFHVVCYLETNDNLLSCFRGVVNKLEQGGLFIFDVWYSPAVYYQRPETRVRRKENEELKATRIAESRVFSDLNVVDVNFEIIITDKKTKNLIAFNETHRMRHFSTPEINLLASTTGFKVVDAHEFLTCNAPSENTWGVTYILKKI
jgi:SAM-dependent methyltransferase